jgi:enamine deaminase RidA (YjgF/YER057c/UK114 family)
MIESSSDRRTFLSGTLLGVGALGALGAEEALSMVAGSAERAATPAADLITEDDVQQSAIVPAVQVGNLLFVSGHGPRGEDGQYIVGKVGGELTAEQGMAAARACANTMMTAIEPILGGNLDRIVRVVKVLGMVNSAPTFTGQPGVVNGFSNALIERFGAERGRGARSAVGVAALPQNWAVEVEAIFEIRPA